MGHVEFEVLGEHPNRRIYQEANFSSLKQREGDL